MKKKVRVFFAILSVIFLEGSYYYVSGKFGIPLDSNIIWFQAGALSFLLGVFLTEYFHTKPTDALLTSFSLFFTTFTLPNPPYPVLWNAFKFVSVLVFLGALFLSWVDKKEYDSNTSLQKASRTIYLIIKELGSAKILCTIAFILGVISFVEHGKQKWLLIFWIVIFAASSVKPHSVISKLFSLWKGTPGNQFIGYVTKFEEPNLVYIEVTQDLLINQVLGLCTTPVFDNSCLYVMVVDKFLGNNSRFVRAIILDQKLNEWNGQGYAFITDTEDMAIKDSHIYQKRNKIIGLVGPYSEIGKLNIHIDNDKGLVNNNDIVEVIISDRIVLYQIVNAIVNEETVAKDTTGYKKAIAVQIGLWNKEKLCFEDYKWVPQLNTIVFKTDPFEEGYVLSDDLCLIGTFNTGHPIIAKKAELVTHNTAILGVTGSGKSYLGYSIIEGLLARQIKVICIDNTGDYQREVQWPQVFHITNEASIDQFLSIPDKFSIATATNVASVLLIVNKVYEWAKNQYNPNQLDIVPRVCVFMEEAHSAIPEWNSIVEKADQEKVNKISKLVMQGRKLGVGVVVVTQRTANVTKSILSQCNTIISFQAFDKTSNDFLSSFMDESYVDNISRLENGCAVIAGKALLSGRPVIIRAPNRNVTRQFSLNQEQAAPTMPDGGQ